MNSNEWKNEWFGRLVIYMDFSKIVICIGGFVLIMCVGILCRLWKVYDINYDIDVEGKLLMYGREVFYDGVM